MPRLIRHPEDVRASGGGRRQKAGTQAVARKLPWIEANTGRMTLDDFSPGDDLWAFPRRTTSLASTASAIGITVSQVSPVFHRYDLSLARAGGGLRIPKLIAA
jgi:hypothetical protein